MKKQEPAHPSEPKDKQSESQSELMTRVLRDMEALDLIKLGLPKPGKPSSGASQSHAR